MGKANPLLNAKRRGRPAKNRREESALRTGFEGNTQAPSRKVFSVFKQPVTQVSTAWKESRVLNEDHPQMKKHPVKKSDVRPFQAMWAKSLSGLSAMVPAKIADKVSDIENAEFLKETLHLAGRLEIACAAMDEQATAATLCHSLNVPNPIGSFGQTSEKKSLDQAFLANLLPDQPMIERVSIAQLNEDILTQEKRVLDCRKRLQEVMKHFG